MAKMDIKMNDNDFLNESEIYENLVNIKKENFLKSSLILPSKNPTTVDTLLYPSILFTVCVCMYIYSGLNCVS